MIAIIPVAAEPEAALAVVAGRPAIVHSIDQALLSGSIDRVVVVTDHAEVAQVAAVNEAQVIGRPSPDGWSAVVDAACDGSDPTAVMVLEPLAPVRRPEHIDGAVTALHRSGADSVVSGHRLLAPVWTAAGDSDDNPPAAISGQSWLQNGSILVATLASVRRHDRLDGGRVELFATDRSAALRVDDPLDRPIIDRLMPRHPPRLSDIDLVVFDFDGVFTDNSVYVDQHGIESVRCSRGDGYGLDLLRRAGLDMAILSTETNPVVAARAAKLQLPVISGSRDKGADIEALVNDRSGLSMDRVAFVGNDLNDLPALARVGVPIATANAVSEVKARCVWVTERAGGQEAVRELADTLLAG